ncbi:MAG: group III truncated hemoglobin [Pseudomonadota bacterium]
MEGREAGFRAPAHASITEAQIAALVDTFYDQVWSDPRLGPIFSAHIDDRPAHLATMKRFWSSVLLKTGTYKGRPVPAHIKLAEVQDGDFEIWLGLFREACEKTFAPEPAAVVICTAKTIARSLWLAMFPSPERLQPPWT